MYTTLVFVENGDKPFTCGFQLTRHSISRAPEGRVRVARFATYFSPLDGHGYYGDVYLRRFVRKWRKQTARTKQQARERSMARIFLSCKTDEDALSEIVSFL
jgi:hypothetical protein